MVKLAKQVLPLLKIKLQDDSLQGSIPSSTSNNSNLEYLNLNSTIPSEIWLLASLYVLRLDNNKLTNTIPSENGLLTRLERMLKLDVNQLIGTIPSEVGLLLSLNSLSLDSNRLSGTIPSEIGLLSDLESIFV